MTRAGKKAAVHKGSWNTENTDGMKKVVDFYKDVSEWELITNTTDNKANVEDNVINQGKGKINGRKDYVDAEEETLSEATDSDTNLFDELYETELKRDHGTHKVKERKCGRWGWKRRKKKEKKAKYRGLKWFVKKIKKREKIFVDAGDEVCVQIAAELGIGPGAQDGELPEGLEEPRDGDVDNNLEEAAADIQPWEQDCDNLESQQELAEMLSNLYLKINSVIENFNSCNNVATPHINRYLEVTNRSRTYTTGQRKINLANYGHAGKIPSKEAQKKIMLYLRKYLEHLKEKKLKRWEIVNIVNLVLFYFQNE